MTTTVTIKHEGPGHHDIVVRPCKVIQDANGTRTEYAGSQYDRQLAEGESTTVCLWAGRIISIDEVAPIAPPPTPQG